MSLFPFLMREGELNQEVAANLEDEYVQSNIRRTREAKRLIVSLHSPMRPGPGIPPHPNLP
jgi:hypothetical protein